MQKHLIEGCIAPEEYSNKLLHADTLTKRNGKKYINLVAAFDIETSKLPSKDESIMYMWQFCFGTITVIGRAWKEFVNIIDQINTDSRILIVYVHNLSYEFQFLRTVLQFEPEDVFMTKPRKILYARYKNIEFRCAYLHSNMSLSQYLDKMETEHRKLDGDKFDYTKWRSPRSELTEKELEYARNDVLGLCEAITKEMELEGDTLITIPLTSTGYVRRDARKAMHQYPRNPIIEMLPEKEEYEFLRRAFRGGNCHANRWYAGRLLENVYSADRGSSYPDVQCNDKFPMSPFTKLWNVASVTLEKLRNLDKCFVVEVYFKDIELRDELWGCPYISYDKAITCVGEVIDNGRVLRADYLKMIITDIDLRILEQEYQWQNLKFGTCFYASYGKLPDELRKVTIDYFVKKTQLKDVEGQEVYYTKSKNKLNSVYGMMAQDPVKDELKLMGMEYITVKADIEKTLSNKSAYFMPYQWGVWVTAHARYRLEEGIQLAGDNFVYCDTDCVKSLTEIDWSAYNKKRIKASKQNGAFAADPHGKMHYMGVYETEKKADKFVTWGAKKYCAEYGKKLIVTVSGVSRKYSAAELNKKGGIKAFRPGMKFRDAGGLEAVYNDHEPYIETVDGEELLVTSNVCLLPSVYTLGIATRYEEILLQTGLTTSILL